MVYQNRAGQGTRTTGTPASVRPPSVITSQPRVGNYQRESLRIPVTRRVVSVPGSSHGSPVVGLDSNLLSMNVFFTNIYNILSRFLCVLKLNFSHR